MEQETESDVVRLIEWALMTIRDKLQFGLPEEIAIQRREMRVKGVLVDVLKQVKELESQIEHVTDLSKEIEQNYLIEKEKVAKAIEFIKEYKEKYYEHAPFCEVGKYDNRCDCGVDNWQDDVDNFIAGNYVQKDDSMLTTKEALAVTITLFKELKVEKEALENELKLKDSWVKNHQRCVELYAAREHQFKDVRDFINKSKDTEKKLAEALATLKVYKDAEESALTELSEHGQYE
jgi:hypothetical protein